MKTQLAALALATLAAGCGGSSDHVATSDPGMPSTPRATVSPACVKSQPVPRGILTTIAAGVTPGDALTFGPSAMATWERVYRIVVVNATAPDGHTFRAAWRWAPMDQSDISSGATWGTLNEETGTWGMQPDITDVGAQALASRICLPSR